VNTDTLTMTATVTSAVTNPYIDGVTMVDDPESPVVIDSYFGGGALAVAEIDRPGFLAPVRLLLTTVPQAGAAYIASIGTVLP